MNDTTQMVDGRREGFREQLFLFLLVFSASISVQFSGGCVVFMQHPVSFQFSLLPTHNMLGLSFGMGGTGRIQGNAVKENYYFESVRLCFHSGYYTVTVPSSRRYSFAKNKRKKERQKIGSMQQHCAKTQPEPVCSPPGERFLAAQPPSLSPSDLGRFVAVDGPLQEFKLPVPFSCAKKDTRRKGGVVRCYCVVDCWTPRERRSLQGTLQWMAIYLCRRRRWTVENFRLCGGPWPIIMDWKLPPSRRRAKMALNQFLFYFVPHMRCDRRGQKDHAGLF